MSELRRQLSLFVPGNSAEELEAVRRIVDPVQSGLIPAHVTLCREDEIGQLSLSEIQARLSNPKLEPITLRFGQAEAFLGHGILLNCIGGLNEFQALREQILGSREIRAHQPHITLAHPRNPKAPGNSLSAISSLRLPISIQFDQVSVIEQEGRESWRSLQSFLLGG